MVIAAERAGETPAGLVRRVVAAVGYTELVHGIYRADTKTRRTLSRNFLAELASQMTTHAYTAAAAEIAGRIDAEQRMRGVVVPFADLLIGATALSLGFSVLTANERHFRLIPGLDVIAF